MKKFTLMAFRVMRSATLLACASLVSLSACTTTADLPAPHEAGQAQTQRSSDALQQLVDTAHARFRDRNDGNNADYIPELAAVPSGLFGLAIATVDGRLYTAGDASHTFSIQSVSKPFTAALVMQQHDAATLRDKIGVEPTGFPFNSIEALALLPQRPSNPLVNAGAIAAVSLVNANNTRTKYAVIEDWFSDLAGEPLHMMPEVYRSEAGSNQGNRAITALLVKYDRLYDDAEATLDVYTRQCAIGVTARQLAWMGATLANNGVNPRTDRRVLDPALVPKVLALMTMAGFYDESGHWAFTTGLPAKTGVGGGIVAIVPGKMAIAGFSPPLDKAGNSVRAALAIEFIANALGANIFSAAPQ